MMRKELQIILLAFVFIVCLAGGYALGTVLGDMDGKSDQEYLVNDSGPGNSGRTQDEPRVTETEDAGGVVSVDEQVTSELPVINSVSKPRRESSGNYTFDAKASVPTDAPIVYVLFSDPDCTMEVCRSNDGHFSSVPPSQSSRYYLRAVNLITDEWSEIMTLTGFVKAVMYEKVTADELKRICNSGDYGTAPPKYSHRFAPGLSIVAIGMNQGERAVSSVSEICNKVMMGHWSSIDIKSIEYDSQNRVKKLVIIVNYPS